MPRARYNGSNIPQVSNYLGPCVPYKLRSCEIYLSPHLERLSSAFALLVGVSLVVCILYCLYGDLNDGFQTLCEMLPACQVSSPPCRALCSLSASNITHTTTSFLQHLPSLGTMSTPRLTHALLIPRHGRVKTHPCRGKRVGTCLAELFLGSNKIIY
ncbi:hypothetical protein EDB19DRAFT_193223 [Suillus lakei]|nr:hypothetical protein EDB19DRAFT_193223 [Suillus lakei]